MRLINIDENDSLKAKLIDLQNKASLSEAYKKKLEEIIEYKSLYEDLNQENEELRTQIFELELLVK